MRHVKAKRSPCQAKREERHEEPVRGGHTLQSAASSVYRKEKKRMPRRIPHSEGCVLSHTACAMVHLTVGTAGWARKMCAGSSAKVVVFIGGGGRIPHARAHGNNPTLPRRRDDKVRSLLGGHLRWLAHSAQSSSVCLALRCRSERA
ncbi:hypothetical protein MRX96_018921 [Rhipicephalus microplus]